MTKHPPTDATRAEHYLKKIFIWGVALKAFDGALETAAGIALLFGGQLSTWANGLIYGELAEDPHDFIATHLQQLTARFTVGLETFLVFYLLVHGIVKITLAIGLIRDHRWAYPTALVLFTAFAVYQAYQYFLTPSSPLLVLTLFDIAIIGLTWHEYRYEKKYRLFKE